MQKGVVIDLLDKEICHVGPFFRVEPAGNEILAEHHENQPFRLPMTITVVDQKNEVAVVEIDDGGNIVRH